jgi:hypothetical protein
MFKKVRTYMTEFIVSHFQWVLGAIGVLITGLVVFLRKKPATLPPEPALHDLVKKRAEEDQTDRVKEEARMTARTQQEILAKVKIERDRVELVTNPTPTTDDADKLMREVRDLSDGGDR